MAELRFNCSPEQEEVIADHLLLGHKLGMQPDERAWILAHAKKAHPNGRVIGAHLDLGTAQWVVQVKLEE